MAGTNVYEDRRAESIKNIAEAEAKRAKVDELLEVIEERLNELEEEKKELKEFSTKDKERRCLEYSIYQRELTDVTAKLSEVREAARASVILKKKKRAHVALSNRSKKSEPTSSTPPTRHEMPFKLDSARL